MQFGQMTEDSVGETQKKGSNDKLHDGPEYIEIDFHVGSITNSF